jgi:Kef-type K+ transport system membrane component KefB
VPEATEGLLHEPLPIFLSILAVILLAPLITERLRLPSVVGLIVGGIIVGPYGFNLLGEGRIVELFATIGLIYLMFNAGLEVDLGQFNRVRNKSIIFGLLTFTIPLIGGAILGRVLGFSWAGSILLGSALSSHTLIAFPILARMGVVSNETVAVTVGATVFTDVSAFLILAVITGISGGDLSIGEFALLLGLMAALALLLLLVLPRVGKFVLQHIRGRDVEFQFVLVALFLGALLAELIGVHAVVGAFLTGLAINSMLPHRSQVIGRLLFVGEALFIPAFLVYSGMITDPTAFIGGDALVIGLAMTAIAYVAKFIAAFITARIFKYNRDELWVMWGLSQCQAAVTLPTVLVGVEAGLFPVSVFNGTMLMILATSITSPLIVQRFAPKLRAAVPPPKTRSLFERVLVAVSNPETQDNLLALTDVLVGSKGGMLLPLNIGLDGRGKHDDHQPLALTNIETLRSTETAIQPIRRIDDSIAKGILYTAEENEATVIAMGWRGKATFSKNVFGTVLDEVLWGAHIPAMVMRITTPINGLEHVKMIILPGSTALDFIDEMSEAALTIADAVNVPLVVLTARQYYDEVCDCLKVVNIEHPYKVNVLESGAMAELSRSIEDDDLVILSTTGTRQRFQSSLGKIPEELAARTEASLMVLHYPI